MKKLGFLSNLILFLLCSCSARNTQDLGSTITSMQIIDRHGFTETISNKERLATYKSTDFLSPQPYQKVLRVYGRNAQAKSAAKITSYHENGQLYQYLEVVDGRAKGLYRQWFPNGKLKIEARLIEGLADIHDLAQKSWVFDGLSHVWNEEGQLMAEIRYEKGLLHTPSLYYHPNGKLHKILPYKTGMLDGDLLVYDDKGLLLEHTPYVAGCKQGNARSYWADGSLLHTEEYENDLLQEASYYDQNGQCIAQITEGKGQQALFKDTALYSLIEYRNGVAEGAVCFFNENGTLHTTYTIKEGKKQGEEWEYYPSKIGEKPQPKICLHWHDDLLQGVVKTWYPNSIMQSQREVNGNKKQGLSFAWYTNGDLMLMEEYENDLLIKGTYFKKGDKIPISKIEGGKGLATLYTNEGIFLRKVVYEKGHPKLDEELLQ